MGSVVTNTFSKIRHHKRIHNTTEHNRMRKSKMPLKVIDFSKLFEINEQDKKQKYAF
jgi:hypothetical protein